MLPDPDKIWDIKSTLTGYINDSLFLLKKDAAPDDKAVHDIRVLMKKSRAVMRLLVTQIDKSTFNREYNAYREAGSVLRLWRETSVHRKTLKDLKKRYPAAFSELESNEILIGLMKKPEKLSDIPSDVINNILKISDLLNRSRYRIRFQRLNSLDPQLLFRELEKTYDKVSDLFLQARNSPKPANLHEFRKRAKDFLYQLCFFRQLKPAVVKNLEKRLDVMTQCLGSYNDLAVLVDTLGYKYSSKKKDPCMDELIVTIRLEQDKHLIKVWPAAYRIFGPRRKLINILGLKELVY